MAGYLSNNQREVLGNLVSHRAVDWLRPMDCGGTDASHHSKSLADLVKLGLAERRDRGSLTRRRAVWLYRATDAGRAAMGRP